MERLGPVLRLSLGLVVLTSSVLFLVDLVGLIPDAQDAELELRIRLSETVAAQLMPAVERGDFSAVRSTLDITVARNPEVLSAGLRAPGGQLLVVAGKHRELWDPADKAKSSATHVRLPLFQRGRKWGTVEIRYEGRESPGLLVTLWERPLFRLVLGVAVLGFALYMVYLKRALRHLDPSAVIPSRVQNALDVMTEGVLLLDERERIVLANTAFAHSVDRTPASLLGVKASRLRWHWSDVNGAGPEYPWLISLRDGKPSTGTSLHIETAAGVRTYAVNAAPVLDGWDRPKGAIVTLDDVTELERKTAALEAANEELEKSRDEIRFHAEEMEILARRDPLTGVANRRAFMEWAEKQLATAQAKGSLFCCLMADIDHFKHINDEHGHAMGDEVIRRVAEIFASEVRTSDAVCRYGGEEFCVAFPGAPIESATRVAERLREKIGAPGFARVPVTMSFGVVSLTCGAKTLSELLDHADQALYASKEGGRNRVTRWDDIAG